MEAYVGDLVYYILDNKVHNAPILSKMTVECSEIDACTKEQQETFEPFGESCIKYATCHGVFTEVYLSKQGLLESL